MGKRWVLRRDACQTAQARHIALPIVVEIVDEHGVITVGIDTPSVDLFDAKDLPAHKAILRHNMSILEGLVLKGVPPGDYELMALPLPLVGFDLMIPSNSSRVFFSRCWSAIQNAPIDERSAGICVFFNQLPLA